MEIQVIIKEILPTVSYQKKDGSGEVKKYAFVGEAGGQYPNPIRFDVIGRNADAIIQNVKVGQPAAVSFDVRARQWNGKWYNDVVAWKVVGASGVQSQQAPQQQVQQSSSVLNAQPQQQASVSNDNLPF